MDSGGPQLDVVGEQRGVVGLHGPRGRVVGLVVAVRVVLLRLTVVLEEVGRQLDCGDSAAVSDILALCVAKQSRQPVRPTTRATSQHASQTGRQSVRAQTKTTAAHKHHRKQRFGSICCVLIGLAGQEEGGGTGRKKGHRGTRVTKGYQELPRVTESGLPRLQNDNTESAVRRKFRTNRFK